MAWISQYNGHKIQRVFVMKDGVLREAVDVYDVKDGAPRKWVRDGGHYIPEHYYIQKEDETFLFLSESGLPIITE